MASKQELDMEALHMKVDAILDHLGLSVDTKRGAQMEAEERARKYWAPGGEGYLMMRGGPEALKKAQAEREADAKQQAEDAKAYQKSQQAVEEIHAQSGVAAAKAAEAEAQQRMDALDAEKEAVAKNAPARKKE